MFLQPVDTADHGGLTGTGWTTDNNPLALGHFEVHIAQDVKITIPFVDVLQLNADLIQLTGGGILGYWGFCCVTHIRAYSV